jgi:hypothetical protein
MDIEELICKVKVALSAVFALDDSFALHIELLRGGARLKTQSGGPRSEADI